MMLYTELLYRPLFNALFFFYGLLPAPDMGVAIVLLTIAVRLLLLPPTLRTLRAQKRLSSLQPQVEALKERHGKDSERMAKELMALYKRERVNPLSSCLPLLIQLPLLIALYQVFQQGLAVPPDGVLYSFVPRPGSISPLAFGLVDLTAPSLLLLLVTAAAQYVQTKMLPTSPPPVAGAGSTDERQTAVLNRQMQFLGPIMTAVIGFSLPSALMLYWLVSTLAQIGIQWYSFRGLVPERA